MLSVMVVCTGNIIRSPALACALVRRRPDLEVRSAAVGRNAKPGLRMKKPMREILEREGWGGYAHKHRSMLLSDWLAEEEFDLIVGVTPVHMKRLAELAPGVPRILTEPTVKDPVRGGPAEYEEAWSQILRAAEWLDSRLPERYDV